VPGVVAVALGGSFARGRARPDSDLDLGVYYEDGGDLDLRALGELAARLHDGPEPALPTAPGAWGRWANGGAWLRVGDRRVDWIYRDLPALRAVVADCHAGRIAFDSEQQPPFGFVSWTWAGELAVARPLHDPRGALAEAKRAVASYPPALRARVVGDLLWSAEFALHAARGFAARGDAVHVAACLARAARGLVHALFAWNEAWFLSEKSALAEIAEMPARPPDFGERLGAALAALGRDPAALWRAVSQVAGLHRETSELCAALYAPKWRLPG
jgi:hypothetical protein